MQSTPPKFLYFGVDKRRRFKLLPLPFGRIVYAKHGEYHQWASAGDCGQCKFNLEIPNSFGVRIDCGYSVPDFLMPYSVRSVTAQLGMLSLIPCHYFVSKKGIDGQGNLILEEGCMERCLGCDYTGSIHDCSLVSGRTMGPPSCAGLEFLRNQCQSDNERTFLDLYLRMNKDREGPMPIPQCYVDPLDRYRSDFVLVAKSNISRDWEWLSIELDSRMYHQNSPADAEKDAVVSQNGFRVIRIRTEGERSILRGVRELLLTLERL